MSLELIQFNDVVGEVVFINPDAVRCVRATPNPKEVRIVFDKDHNVVVKAGLEKTIALLTGAKAQPTAA